MDSACWCAGKAHGCDASRAAGLTGRIAFQLSWRPPLAFRAPSFLIDGEAIVCGPDGRADFDALRSRRRDRDVVLFAFDLLELKGEDWRSRQLAERKKRLTSLLARASGAIQLTEHLDDDGELVFAHACRLGLEGIVSKRIDAPYRSGPCKTWLKSKNPESDAVRREREEDWS